MPTEPQPFTPTQALAALRSRAWLPMLCALVVATSAFGFAQLQAPRYTATATLRFAGQPPSAAQIDALASTTRAVPRQSLSNAQLAQRPGVVAATAAALGDSLGAAEIKRDLSVEPGSEFRLVEISATSASAELAARIANGYARRLVVFQNGLNERRVEKGLAALRRLQGAGDTAPAPLAVHVRVLQTIARTGYGDVTVAGPAVVPSDPSYPDVRRDILTGLAIGLLLGSGLALRGGVPESRWEAAISVGGWDGRAAGA